MSEHDHRDPTSRPAVSGDTRHGKHGLAPVSPGKQTLVDSLVQQMPAVPRTEAPTTTRADPAAHASAVRAAAAHGIAGSSGPLPFAHSIQRLFGRHDIGDIQAHTDESAAAGARSMGAEAFKSTPRPDQPLTSGSRETGVQRSPAAAPTTVAAAPPNGMWEHTFGEASTPVGKLGRVQAPKGVYLRTRPLPGAESPAAPIPFNGLVHVERRTTQAHANQRWCYVVATETGTAGFCEERYLAIDPPEPTAKLRRTAPGERLAAIAAEAFGTPTDENNSRLQVQVLYVANRDRAGVKLDHVDLSFKDRALRGDDETTNSWSSTAPATRSQTRKLLGASSMAMYVHGTNWKRR